MTVRRAEFIAVGSELLEPWRLDTNGSFITRRLGGIGIPVAFRTVVGDDLDDLKAAFRVAIDRCGLVVATGGLGPTVDDLTREAVADLLGLPLVEDPRIAAGIAERFHRRGYPMAPSNLKQALVPRGATPLANRLGTAPGLFLRERGLDLVLLPGVPAEMRAMFDEEVMPRLEAGGERYVYRILKVAGLTESEVDHRLADVARQAGQVAWTILASPGQIEIHLKERLAAGGVPTGIERLDGLVGEILGVDLFGRDDEAMETVVGGLLCERRATLAVAESLTGGLIGSRLTSVPGASRYFLGGVMAYGDDVKAELLGVRRQTLASPGAVSAESALEMAEGARRALRADWGVSATGYAGPDAGGAGTPVGAVFLGVAGPGTAATRRLSLPGDRETIRIRAAQSALDLLRRALLGLLS